MKKLLTTLGVILGLFLIVRAVVEPFVIDFHDPATFHLDWGGPSLPGVLAVHCGPGIVAAAWMVSAAKARVGRRPGARTTANTR
jgi:hypothetical protein